MFIYIQKYILIDRTHYGFPWNGQKYQSQVAFKCAICIEVDWLRHGLSYHQKGEKNNKEEKEVEEG